MKYEELRHLRHALRTLEESLSQLKAQLNMTEVTVQVVGKHMDKVINSDMNSELYGNNQKEDEYN